MNRPLPRLACVVLLAWLALYGLEMLARAQTTGTGTAGGSGGGSLLSGGGGGISGGSTMSGGSTGQSFSGGDGASFSGGTTSGYSTTRGSGSSSSTTVPAASNVFGPTAMNPWSRGIKNSSGTMEKGSYNQPIYVPKTTTSARTTAPRSTKNTANSTTSFTTQGLDRSIPYATGLHDDLPVVRPADSALQVEVRDIIQRSLALPSKDKISATVSGNTVTLSGEVASARERGLVERMLRLEPGVRIVDNQLTVAGAANQ